MTRSTALRLEALAGLLGLLGLLGNVLDVPVLMTWIAGRPAMAPTTGVCLMLAAAGLAIRHGRDSARWRSITSSCCGLTIFLFGLLVLYEYVWRPDLLADLAGAPAWLAHLFPRKPSPFTALALVALGAALLLFDVQIARRAALREWLALLAVFPAFVSLVGHAYGADALYTLGGTQVIGVALPTGIALVALGLAMLLERTDVGLMRLFASNGPGGVVLRHLGLTAVLLGPLVGAVFLAFVTWLQLQDLPLILAMNTVLLMFGAGFLLVVTARHLDNLHAAVEANRLRLQELFTQAPEGIFLADLSGRYTAVNAAGCRLLGVREDEILGKTIVDIIAPEDAPRLWASREQMLRGEVNVEEWRLRRKDGTWVPAEVTAKILPDGRWQAFVHDITQRRELESKLHESRDVLRRQLAEQEFLARVGIELAACLERREALKRVAELTTSFLGDACAIFVKSARGFERAQVHHRDPCMIELLARNPPAPESIRPPHPLWQVIEEKRSMVIDIFEERDLERFALTADHRETLTQVGLRSLMLVPLLARGQLLAVICVGSCDSERRYKEPDLRLAEELARRAALTLDNVQLYQQSLLQAAVTTNMAEGVVLIGADDGTILYANPRFEAMFGYPPHELIGKPVHVLNAEDDLSPVQRAQAVMSALSRAGEWHGEIKNVRKDGSAFWCAASVSTFEREEGRVWIAIHMDITQRKALEHKTAQALRDKETLLKEIHHRVKNNLQVVSSLFSLQRERTHSEELKLLLDESRTRVQSIALVHEQLYRSADLAAIDLDGYLRDLLRTIRSSYGADRVQIDANATAVVLDVEQAVPCALVVCELVSNALKHAFPTGDGKLSVTARRDARGRCVLEVADDGIGVPLDFDWQNARSLGLRLVRALARQLRGTVELDRAHGTCFRVTFASAQEASLPAAERPQAAARS